MIIEYAHNVYSLIVKLVAALSLCNYLLTAGTNMPGKALVEGLWAFNGNVFGDKCACWRPGKREAIILLGLKRRV